MGEYSPRPCPMYPGELSDANICNIFQDAGDFVHRKIQCAPWSLYLYSIDGLVSGGDISDYVLSMELGGISVPFSLDAKCPPSAANAEIEKLVMQSTTSSKAESLFSLFFKGVYLRSFHRTDAIFGYGCLLQFTQALA